MFDEIKLQGSKTASTGKWKVVLWGHEQDGPNAGKWRRIASWQAYDMQHRLTAREQVTLIFSKITRP